MAKMKYPANPKTSAQQDQKWEAERDVRTLSDANEIIKDKARHKRAKDCAKAQMKALESLEA